ncbi:universal stress protein [Slackia heliotrinireducens]|uniref:universal stress protein n=1 Tax=Slackia heliotrinireducens TaxID=84110 RepID=UPI00331648FC
MAFNNVLVPYDGSDHSKKALSTAVELVAALPDAKLTALTVVPAYRVETAGSFHDVETQGGVPAGIVEYDQYKQAVQLVLDKAKAEQAESIGDIMAPLGERAIIDAIAESSVVEGIVEYAEKHEVDLIVMGRRGLGAIRAMLGSVSYGVLHSTDISVMTVK